MYFFHGLKIAFFGVFLGFIIVHFGAPVAVSAETNDYSVEQVRESLIEQFNRVQDFAVKVRVDMNMPGFRMPKKMVEVLYKKPDKFKVESASFAIVPKTGLMISPEKIFTSMADAHILSTDSNRIEIQAGFNPDSAKMEMGASKMQDLKEKMKIHLWVDPDRWVITKMQTFADTVAFMNMQSTYVEAKTGIWLPETTRLTFQVPSNFTGSPHPPEMSDEELKKAIEEHTKNQQEDVKGTVILEFLNYKVNTGLSDDLFEKEGFH